MLFNNWYLFGEKEHFKPRPQNRILVPLRSSFQNFCRASCPFLGESPSPRNSPESVRLYNLLPRLTRLVSQDLSAKGVK